ncbi:fimbrial protein [Providencia rettgeri]
MSVATIGEKPMKNHKKQARIKALQGILGILCLVFGTYAYAGANCTPNGGHGWNPAPLINIDMNTTLGSIPAGTTLGSASTGFFSWKCNFSGSVADRTVYFRNQTPASTKAYMLSNGVRLYQHIYQNEEVEITASSTPRIKVGYWNQGQFSIGFLYIYTLRRGVGPLKSFDTGLFTVGTHEDGTGRGFGDIYRAQIVGKLVNYCPTPIVTMSNKVVDFKELTPEQFDKGKTVKENFNLALTPISTCEAALEVSVAFQSNSGVVNKKYLMFDNGLQIAITDKSLGQEINFDQYYYKGQISQQKPGNFQYSAELSNKSNGVIKPGPFSNTVNVLFSYR